MTSARSSKAYWAILACLLLALGLRIWGLKFGLPELYYWDEPTVVNRAMRFGTGDLNPHYFYYPAFYKYVLFVSAGIYFALGRVTGMFGGAQDFARTYFVDPSGVYTAARLTTAVVGVLAVLACYRLGERFFGRRVGLLAAALLAVSPLHVTHSHIAITDVPQALLVCLATIAARRVLLQGDLRHYALCGLLIGLGTATKYMAVLNLATLALAHLLRNDSWRRPRFDAVSMLRSALSRKLWLGFACSFVGFFVGSPYNVLSFSEFVADFRAQMALSGGAAGQGALLLRTTLTELGLPACALALLGSFVMLRRVDKSTWVFLCFPAVYALTMLGISKSFARYLLPQSAFIAVAAAVGFWSLGDWLARRAPRVDGRLGFAVLALALLAWPTALSVSWCRLQSTKPDTRTLALRWAERELPAGSKVAIQSLYDRTFDNVPLVTDKTLGRLERVLPTSGSFGRVRQQVLDAWRARPVYVDVGWSDDAATLASAQPRYVLVTEAYGKPSASVGAWLARSARELERFEPEAPWPLRWLPDNGSETLPVIPPKLLVYAVDG